MCQMLYADHPFQLHNNPHEVRISFLIRVREILYIPTPAIFVKM